MPAFHPKKKRPLHGPRQRGGLEGYAVPQLPNRVDSLRYAIVRIKELNRKFNRLLPELGIQHGD